MTHKDHGVFTALAALGVLLTLFQWWYVHLPAGAAAAFDLCQLTDTIDCFKARHQFDDLRPFGIPVFVTLAALCLLQLMLCAFAYPAGAARRETWLAIAGLVWLPTAGLALYVILNDIVVAKVTSLSALLIAAASLAACARAMMRGLRGVSLRHGAPLTLVLVGSAALMGFFLHGAGRSWQQIDETQLARETAPPSVRWTRFDHAMPRAGAAMLGEPMAKKEILVFVDPEQEESRRLMARLANEESETLYVFYAAGNHGTRLILAHRQGNLREYLRTLEPPAGDPADVRAIVERQERGRVKLGVTEYPTLRER